jgi:hypothetical protein
MSAGVYREFVSPDQMVLGKDLSAASEKPEAQGLPRADPALTQDSFDELLSWLGPDPEAAGMQYELIRARLITIFRCRGCLCPEDLADATFNRVSRKLTHIKPRYSGSPARYFYGVAKKIYLEHRNCVAKERITSQQHSQEEPERMLEYLDEALNMLDPADKELVLEYYEHEGQRKIDHRKELARRKKIEPNALRLRVHRIRSALRRHVLDRSLTPEGRERIDSRYQTTSESELLGVQALACRLPQPHFSAEDVHRNPKM